MFEIGTSLREARARRHLGYDQVEAETKIRAKYIRCLEEEDFGTLPSGTYIKGFLRTYADYLGLDGQLYVDEYNSRYGVGDDEQREPVVARRSSTVHQRHRRLERRGVVFALAGIGALFALVIAAWKFSGNDTQPIPNLGSTTGKQAKSAGPAKNHHRRAVKPPFHFFVVSVGGPSWMEVRNYSASGPALFTGTLDLH